MYLAPSQSSAHTFTPFLPIFSVSCLGPTSLQRALSQLLDDLSGQLIPAAVPWLVGNPPRAPFCCPTARSVEETRNGGSLSKVKTEPAGTAQWLHTSVEPPGQELEKPLRLSFPNSPCFTQGVCFYRLFSDVQGTFIQLPMQLKRSERTIIKQGLRQAGWAGRQPPRLLQGARPRRTRARSTPGPPASCSAWQLREARRSARPPDFSRAPAADAATTTPHYYLAASTDTRHRAARPLPRRPGTRAASPPRIKSPAPQASARPPPAALPHSAGGQRMPWAFVKSRNITV